MKKWIFLAIIFLVVGGGLYYVTFGYYSDGTRVGSLIKLSKRGYLFKTYEGQLNVGGMSDGTGSLNATQWEFSVDDDNKAVVVNLEQAMKMGQRVSLHYEEKFFQLPWNGDTQYFVTSVELIPMAMPIMPQIAPQPAAPVQVPAPAVIDTASRR